MSVPPRAARHEPLVMLPGMMGDARLFGPQLGFLSAQRSVIVCPLIGGDQIDKIARTLLENLPPRFAVLGHGLGGMVAMEMHRHAAKRITRLALVSSSPLPETPQDAADREEWIIAAKAGKYLEVLAKTRSGPFWSDVALRLRLRDISLEMARDIGSDVFIDQVRALQRRRDLQPSLRRCKVPAMVICGENDPLYPQKRQEISAKLIPNAVFMPIEGAGHWPSLEAPEAFGAAIKKWLTLPQISRPVRKQFDPV